VSIFFITHRICMNCFFVFLGFFEESDSHPFFFFPSFNSVMCNYVLHGLLGCFSCLFSSP
jgi:hypothetical protein